MKIYFLAALVVITLSGCGVDKMIRDDDLQQSRSKCAEYGFRPGSVEFANCMQRPVGDAEQQRERSYFDSERRREARGASGSDAVIARDRSEGMTETHTIHCSVAALAT